MGSIPYPAGDVPAADDDIAIIGFSLKLPGEATSAENFWNMLLAGRSAASEFPANRLNLNDIDRFDAPFFSISPAEAACMEPQQRHMLETSYRALENAGITVSQCSGTRTSVHTGSFTDDYRSVLFHDRLEGHMYAATGIANSILANRVSWFFNFTGPSLNLDTACSSSITALHLACQDLRSGVTDMGLVGGCNLIYHPDYMVMMSNMSFLSPDSRCWSLDERANGYARGEGFGVAVIKRLCDAVRDGNTVRAVIRATRLNQDGRTPGLTNPSGDAHKALIREAYRENKIDMEPTRFFEAHSTGKLHCLWALDGTQAGDPTEANAVGEVFSTIRSEDDPLWLGAVKPNIGHLEAGSGMASLFKAILVLENGVIPPNACFEKLNPRIQAERFHLRVNSFGFGGSNGVVILDDAYHYLRSRGHNAPTRTRPDPPTMGAIKGMRPPDAVVKSLEKKQSPREQGHGVLVWSSNDEDGLGRVQNDLSAFFSRQPQGSLSMEDLKDVAYTLAKRTQLTWRRSVTYSSLLELLEKLNGPGGSPSALPSEKSTRDHKCGFIFTGQGAQYAGMGLGLMSSYPVFRTSMKRNQELLDRMGCGWQLDDLISVPESPESQRINEPQYSQPSSTALQIALVDLMRSFGIEPSAVVGHSSGEIAAAYATGALCRESALRVAFHRGRLASELRARTDRALTMMAVGLSASAADKYLSKLEQEFAEDGGRDVDIACINSPRNVTLAGDAKQIQFLEDLLQGDVIARRLNIDMAYHSHHMKSISDEYRSCLQDLQPDRDQKRSTIMISSVTGAAIDRASDLTSPEYWIKNLTSTVRFSDAISTLSAQSGRKRKVLGRKASKDNEFKISELVEVGPHHALRGPIRECLEAMKKTETIKYYPTLVRRTASSSPTPPGSATGDILTLAGKLWELGHPIDLLAINNLPREIPMALRVDLPEYPFNHSQVHWRESRVARNYRMRDTPRHDFLGVRSDDWNEKQAHWRNMVSETRLPWLRDHRLAGQYLYPGGGMVVMAVEAARQLVDAEKHPEGPSSFELRDLQILNAFQSVKASESQVETRFTLVPTAENPLWSQFHLFIYESNGWVEVCHGQIRVHHDTEDDEEGGHQDDLHTRWSRHLQNWRTQSFEGEFAESQQTFDNKTFYDLVAAENDAVYGPAFQTLDDIAVSSDGRVMANIQTRKWAEHYGDEHVSSHIIHPATVDALFQMVFPVLLGTGDTIVPTRVGRMWINARGLDGLSHRGLSTLRAQVVCSRKGARGTTVGGRVVSPDTGEPLLDLENYESTIVGTKDDLETEPRKLCATMQWRPDVEAMSQNELASVLAATSSHDSESDQAQGQSYMDQNLVIQYFLSEAMDRLENKVSHPSDSHSQGIVQWVQHQSSRTDKGDAQIERMRNDPAFRKRMFHQVANLGTGGGFLMKLAENISDAVLGKLDFRELLSDSSLVQDFRKSHLSKGPCIPPMKGFLELLGHKNPAMRILELHGGNGDFTEVVTSALLHEGRPRWSSYDFTDVSAETFPELQERFGGIANSMDYRVLDTDGDAVGQGFNEAAYDLVVTCGVLQRIGDMERIIQTASRLLKPHGKVMLFETTNPDAVRAGLYGALTGSLCTSTTAQANYAPFYSTKSWTNALESSGLGQLDLVLQDSMDPETFENSLMIASKAPEDDHIDAVDASEATTTILVDSRVPEQRDLAESLQLCLGKGRSDKSVCRCVDVQSLATSADIDLARCISLLDVARPFLFHLQEHEFETLKHLVASSGEMLWVSRGCSSPTPPEFSMIDGFARVMRGEYPLLKLTTLALEPPAEAAGCHGLISRVWRRMLRTDHAGTELEYRQRDGRLEIPRVVHSAGMNGVIATRSKERHVVESCRLGGAPPLALHVGSIGTLDSVCFSEVSRHETASAPLPDDEVLVRAQALGLDHRDFLVASGRLNDTGLGMQWSGTVVESGAASHLRPGDRVCGISPEGLQTLARYKSASVALIPPSLPEITAALLPVAAIVGLHALIGFGGLQEGELVLVHNAASTLGQVAVQIAQSMGALVLAVAKTRGQREMLARVYKIPTRQIFSKGDRRILETTRGRGVDVLFAVSPTQEETDGLWDCVAPFGRFVHVCDDEATAASGNCIPGNAAFTRINTARFLRESRARVSLLWATAAAMFSDGTIYPVTGSEIHAAKDVGNALKFFSSGEEAGGSIVELGDDELVKAHLLVKPLYLFDPHKTYVISGGQEARALAEDLTAQKVQVLAPQCDITDLKQLRAVVEEACQQMPPIAGCIQGAMVLRDSIFETMTWDDWTASVNPKVLGSWNLHLVMPRGLDFFTLLSSISCVLGGVSQSNYAAGNAYMNALCQYRHSIGERGTNVPNLGMMVSEGVVSESEQLLSKMRNMGMFMEIQHEEMFALLEQYLRPQQSSSEDAQPIFGIQLPAAMKAAGKTLPRHLTQPMFRHFHYTDTRVQSDNGKALVDGHVDFTSVIRSADTTEQVAAHMTEWLRAKMSQVLGLDVADIDVDKPISAYGIDSLIGMEIRNWFEKELGAKMAIFELLSAGTNMADSCRTAAVRTRLRSKQVVGAV
ncbi:hypothetical protein KVR01_007409 [Diaporthe batatas]|uniref:uncharacterized protein n=1 Tax=Diaporthe batatas TaxID=748121 RepID=UPI001D05928C|nr:uncharacterized protein KVR01_007409 [Diaporthe batatas]KAG8162931.1 hypothetical protein KVR01_007409 [Diaporthe batatas]